MIGTIFTHYRITEKIGQGGMGVVYKAEDTKLGRLVALKFVRADLLESPHHKERFVREAQASAALDHPNICTVHEIDEADGQMFLAMAFVDGESVKDRIGVGPLKIEEALDIAMQTAEGLQAAHAKGIVHRDIKPANLMVNAQGQVKIMDFGLARLTDRPSVTQTAMILGTPAYMSPEQAEGAPCDRRSDLWSLGVALYEMVTARLPFPGNRDAAVLHAILHREHEPITGLRAGVPIELDRIIHKALAKRPDERYQTAQDILIDLRHLRRQLDSGSPRPFSGAPSIPFRTSIRRERLGWLVMVMALSGLCIWLAVPRSPDTLPVTRLVVNVAPAERLRALRGDDGLPQGRPSRTAIALSPNGLSLVFSGVRGDQQHLYLRALDVLQAVPLAGTDGAMCPFFAPDGQWIGFWAAGALKKVPLAGGPAVNVADVPFPMMSASWGPGESIVFAPPLGGLWRVSARGGKPEPLTALDAGRREVSHRFPQLLPDGQTVLYTITHDSLPNWDRTEIVAQRLGTGERIRLIEGGADARYLPSGHLVYLRHGTLMAAPFDASRLQVTGGSVGIVAGLMQAANMGYSGFDSGAGQFSVSDTGSLAYVGGGPMPDREFSLVWVDRDRGKVAPLSVPPKYYLGPRLSPDGQRVAVAVFSADTDKRNVWIHHIGEGTLRPVTIAGNSGMPVWTPDGRHLLFPAGGAFSGNIFRAPADGTAAPEQLTRSELSQLPSSISPDGAAVAFVQSGNVWVLGLDGKGTLKPVLDAPYPEMFPDFSPDGRWLAYSSTETGRPEVYVQPVSGPGAKRPVSTNGGQAPVWRRDGRELFYHNPHYPAPEGAPLTMMAVAVTRTGSDLTFGSPVKLFEGPYYPSSPIRSYDVTPDGRRFLMVAMDGRPLSQVREIVLVQNWIHELTHRVPSR